MISSATGIVHSVTKVISLISIGLQKYELDILVEHTPDDNKDNEKMSRRHESLLHFYIRRTKYLHNLQVFLSRVNRIIVNTQEKCQFPL